MRRLLKILAAAVGVILLVAGLTVWSLYRRATAPVPEYEAAIAVPDEQTEQDRLRLESQLTTLYSDTQTSATWESVVTDDEVNAWLATRLAATFPQLLEQGLSEPRLMIASDKVALGVRGQVGSRSGVMMIEVRPFATDGGEFAMELLAARVGRLELPIERIVAQIEQLPLDEAVPMRIVRSGTAPVLIVNLGALTPEEETLIQLTGIDLREGEILIRGESEIVAAEEAPPEAKPTAAETSGGAQ